MSKAVESAEQPEAMTDPVEENIEASENHEGEEGKPTLGEELWKVHVARHKGETPSEEDFDRPEGPRKRSRSIGEELWEVHQKRSVGMDPDFDIPNTKTNTKAVKGRKPNAKPKKPARCSDRLAKVMHLRNRDVKKMMIS